MSDNSNNDANEPKRPNANYKLSKNEVNPEDVVYHYNREHRLGKAPKAVQELYIAEGKRRFGIFKSLTDSKPKIMMLISIIFILMLMMTFSFLGITGGAHKIDGLELEVLGIKVEGNIVIALKKTIPKGIFSRLANPYTGAFEITVMPSELFGTEYQVQPEDVFRYKNFFTLDHQQNYNFAVPFTSDELAIIIQTEKSIKKITVKPQ